mgnify:CR=1 FL=1
MSYKSGDDLLRAFNPQSREAKLEQAIRALMAELESLHCKYLHQSLHDNLDNPDVFCSCADAYRMGHAALKGSSDA